MIVVVQVKEFLAPTLLLLSVAGLQLYAVPGRGGLQGTDMTVTTCRLPLNRGVRGKRR